jgi:hypothetical protein
MPWQLIYNNFNILIDPRYFADISTIGEQIDFVDMPAMYLEQTDPRLCKINVHYPEFMESRLGIRNLFVNPDVKLVAVKEPNEKIEFFTEELIPDTEARNVQNELLSIAIENKIPFMLSRFVVSRDVMQELIKKYNISILQREPMQKLLMAFLQGFFNYYKFDLLYGVPGPDLAHAMSDPLHRKLHALENKVRMSPLGNDAKERIRSFVHNRYIDILITVERITFYKIQQQISDIEQGVLENKDPQFHGSVRYYLNYYFLLLWGYVDHMCLIINDLFQFGFDEETNQGRSSIGFKDTKSKKDYLSRLKVVDESFYDFVVSKEFQEWLDILGQLRHRNAHREMISPSPLLHPTEASDIGDAAIDDIIYKDRPPLEGELARIPAIVESRKAMDRHKYRVSKMEKIFDHVAIVKGGFLDPVARIKIDMENLDRLTGFLLAASTKSKIVGGS